MKCTIPEISWHNRDPVLSVDIHNATKDNKNDTEPFWRLATGGGDSHVLIWHVTVNEIGAASINCVADLNRHQKTVNVVRFSPSGEYLATGDDESVIILWKLKEGSEPPPLPGEEAIINKEHWGSVKVLRGHLEDIYDISWSPDSNMLVSGSVDNTAIVWDIQKGRSVHILQDYKGFVQGVSWDPLNQFITTLSTDRQCRLIDLKLMKTIQRANKSKIPTSPGHTLEDKTIRLFHDDTFKSYFRRLTFTIDGSMIIAPSGIIEPLESTEQPVHTTLIFSRNNIREPIMVLPSLDEPTVAVRCCPIYFELRDDGPVATIALPYRLVFAVASQKSVFIYDTQQIAPIAVISNIHYTRLTDLAWSSDGRVLIVSSTDGYCSIIHFEEGELGKIYVPNQPIIIKTDHQNDNKFKIDNLKTRTENRKQFLADCDTDAMDIDVNEFKSDKKSQVELKTSAFVTVPQEMKATENKKIEDKNIEVFDNTEDLKLVYTETNDSDALPVTTKNSPVKNEAATVTTPPKPNCVSVLSAKTPRRVQLITLSSPKRTKN